MKTVEWVRFPLAGLWMLLGAVLIAIFARISYDLQWKDTVVVLTGQSFAVLCFALIAGRVIGTGAVVIYLLAGILGLPVFADGGSGLSRLAAETGGYLYGFLFAAYFVGKQGNLGWASSFVYCLLSQTFGTFVILLTGMLHLALFRGIVRAIDQGFFPYLPGAVFKIFLGTIFLNLLYRLIKTLRSG